MGVDDSNWLAVADAFQAAAFDQSWYRALEGLAQVTGSASGQLIGIGADAAVPFNLVTNVDHELGQRFIEAGGGDPRVNPRVNAGINAPILKALAESDFISPDEYKHHPHYQEFAVPCGVPYICLSTLERNEDMLIGLAVLRSHQQGHITDQERQVFATLAPHVRAAVRTQLALEGNGAALLVGAMDSLTIPAFVCDRNGLVRALSSHAEALIHGDRGLQLTLGRLRAINSLDDIRLKNAMDAAISEPAIGRPPSLHTVVIQRGASDAPSLVLNVVALPARQLEFSFAPRVLVVARTEREQEDNKLVVLQMVYALTKAETEIALHIYHGKSPEAIASLRGVSVGTVRAQLKSIFVKLGVNRQAELVAKLSRL
ncbi:MAG TPA: helix-turn-helix transcriptional regulator [Cellvibrio sp.]|nr:helix-turn-helix transcriptional regulator [Cellvibrio sp.]